MEKTLFEVLDDDRLQKELDVEEYCKMLNISRNVFYRIKHGEVSRKMLYRIANKTNFTFDELNEMPLEN